MSFRNVAKMGTLTVLSILLFSAPISASPPPLTSSATAPATSEVNWFSADRVSTLLQSLQNLNVALTRDAQTLNTFARSTQISWRSHSHYLGNVRDHVNQSGRLLSELQELRNTAHPWQRDAINRIVPIAVDLAGHTEAAIVHLNDNQSRLLAPEYVEHLDGIGDRSLDLQEAVNDFVDYGKTLERLEGLERRLEVTST